ncbi:TIGR04255 family protein [Ralstonia pseudosolanacearum]|uniref:TIGR04255 family protein n=1 Tax=Ralstonia pseudosolanacearum TaxID=1310165 RepID=UPI001FF9B074|nr:TIGR04255 family protein [Ralstonia pseudosolanacearum]
MTSDAALRRGQWAHAPLVFVLAQVRFLPSTTATPEHLRDAITKRVGARFPTVSQTNGVNFEISLDTEPSVQRTGQAIGYDLVNNEVNAMVRIQQGALSYAVTSYTDSPHFREEWLDIADSLADVQVAAVTRLGLRYVDFLMPRRGQRPEDYVHAPWNLNGMPTLPGAAGGPDLHVSMLDVSYPLGRMRLQFMRGVGVPSLPMDLQGMLSPGQPSPQAEPGECGVIDSDRWVDGTHGADRATLNQLFTQMHTDVSSAFRAMITPLAQREWHPGVAIGDNT